MVPPQPKLLPSPVIITPNVNQPTQPANCEPPRNPIPRKLSVNKRLPMGILQKFNSMLAKEPQANPPPTPKTNPKTNPMAIKTDKPKLAKNSPINRRKIDIKQKNQENKKKMSDSLKLWLNGNEKPEPVLQVPDDESTVVVDNVTPDREPMTKYEL